jgi:hypothetical protein
MISQEMPARIAKLRRDHRGFPIPWFIGWVKDGKPSEAGEGEPDFRALDARKVPIAVKQSRCWICGELLGVFKCFLIGPMCAINRVISEPPAHRDCLEFSARTCPFLTKPRMRRNEKDLPEGATPAPGVHLKRNPGAVCLWITRTFKPFRVRANEDAAGAHAGILFRLGEPEEVLWFAEGRAATRQEVLASIESGYPELERIAVQQGPEAEAELQKAVQRALPLLPPVDAGMAKAV